MCLRGKMRFVVVWTRLAKMMMVIDGLTCVVGVNDSVCRLLRRGEEGSRRKKQDEKGEKQDEKGEKSTVEFHRMPRR